MAIVKLEHEKPYRNINEFSLSTNLCQLQDCMFDDDMSIIRRFGFNTSVDIGTGTQADGNYWWDKKDIEIVVSNGQVWKITDKFGTKVNLTSDTLEVGTPVTFAEVYSGSTLYLFMANGGRMVYTDGTITSTYVASANAPTAVTHIVHIDGYLIANDRTSGNENTWFYADNGLPLTWTVGQNYEAEMAVDDIFALVEIDRRLHVLGKRSIEIWYNKGGADPFALVEGSYSNIGTYSPYSVERIDDSLFILTDKLDVIKYSNGQYTTVSQPYASVIQGLSTINDVISDYIFGIDGKKIFLLNFPSEDLTLAYDVVLDAWYEWGYWNGSGYDSFKCRHFIFARAWGLYLIGDNSTGKIYTLSSSNNQDNGGTMRSKVKTGKYSHGTQGWKRSNSLDLDVKRGEGIAGGSAATLRVRWRDDGNTVWGNYTDYSLGAVGDRKKLDPLRPMGRYRNRQYEYVLTDNTPLVLKPSWEDVYSE